jgi:RNA polymerase sigma factor (sigma-70 family)
MIRRDRHTYAPFPQTSVSAIQMIASDNPERRAIAFDRIAAVYWQPVYSHLRIKWGKSRDDAMDWAQQFFVTALEKNTFTAFNGAKSKFRTFVRTCLDNFAANETKAAARIKRGGDAHFIPLDFRDDDHELHTLEIADEHSIEDEFDRQWIRGLFSAALQELKQHCREAKKELHYQLFEAYDVLRDDANKISYDDLAKRHQIPATQVTNHLFAMRRKYRELVLAKLREVTGSDEEFIAEARAILGITINVPRRNS